MITNGLTIAHELERAIPRFEVVVTEERCGRCSTRSWSPWPPRCWVASMPTSPSSAAPASTPVGGVTNVNLPEADLKRIMVGSAERAVVVADGSKLGRTHLGRIAAVDEVAEADHGGVRALPEVAALRDAGLP